MDILIADSTGYELAYLTNIQSFDLDTTTDYDFEIQMDLTEFQASGYTYGYRVYCPNTEFGGLIQDIKIVTNDSKVYLYGDTWRGMLKKKIICPNSGDDYKIVTGEAHTVMKNLIGSGFGDLIVVDSSASGFTISSYQFNRYCTLEEGLVSMLASAGAKLVITYSQENKQVILRAEAIETLGEEYTDDQIHLTVRDYRRGINHLICLGQGDLAERERIDLYADEDGNISTTQTITGVDERVEVYDYSSAESTEELQSGGEAKLKELMNYTTATLELEDVTDLLIHDYVTAEETYTGMKVEEQVTGLTLTIENGQPTITYKLGDDD